MPDAEACRGAFDYTRAQEGFVDYPRIPAETISEAARVAAAAVGRALGPVRSRGPLQSHPGDRWCSWRLEGEPALSVKVLATTERWTLRAFRRARSIVNHLEPPATLRTPRRLRTGLRPAPWVVEEEATGRPATTAALTPSQALSIVSAVQATRIRGFRRLDDWGVKEYERQILQPLADLACWSVITPDAAAAGIRLAHEHLPRVRVQSPTLSHNDLAIHHIFLDAGHPWVIDWENVHHDRLQLLDIAHLMLNHGSLDLAWARELGGLALDQYSASFGVGLRSNLVVALLERATGRAYDAVRRQRRQSLDAVDALCAVLRGDLVSLAP